MLQLDNSQESHESCAKAEEWIFDSAVDISDMFDNEGPTTVSANSLPKKIKDESHGRLYFRLVFLQLETLTSQYM